MCGNAKSITPIGGWKPRLMEHRKVTYNNLFVFPLSNAILLRGVRTRQLMLNAIIQTKGLKMIMVLTPTIRSKSFNFRLKLVLNKSFKVQKYCKHFRFMFKKK